MCLHNLVITYINSSFIRLYAEFGRTTWIQPDGRAKWNLENELVTTKVTSVDEQCTDDWFMLLFLHTDYVWPYSLQPSKSRVSCLATRLISGPEVVSSHLCAVTYHEHELITCIADSLCTSWITTNWYDTSVVRLLLSMRHRVWQYDLINHIGTRNVWTHR